MKEDKNLSSAHRSASEQNQKHPGIDTTTAAPKTFMHIRKENKMEEGASKKNKTSNTSKHAHRGRYRLDYLL